MARKKTMMACVLSAVAALAVVAAPIDDSSWRGGPSDAWFVNWDKALVAAKKSNKKLFVLNTGSDWCHWCKKLREEVLDKPEFDKFAAKNLVLVYLDNPGRNPLGKEQKRHNRQIVKTLAFSGGVPNVGVFTAKGKKLGSIGGGGMKVDAYIERLETILKEKGQYFGDDDVRTLFTDGYGKLAEEIAKQRAKLPPVTKADFKASLTGVAIVDDRQRHDYASAKFVAPDTSLEVPFGKTALFRVEYEFPEGYGARVWTRGDWPAAERRNLYYFGSNPSGLYKGKGTAYGFLSLLERGQSCTLKSLAISTNSDPELDEYPHGWEICTSAVNLDFKSKDDSPSSASVATESKESVEPYVSKSKLHAAYRSKDRNRVFVEVCHQHVHDSFKTPPYTLDRVREAISLKADILFVTLTCSKDGVLFSAEPENIEQISNGTGSIGDYTAAQLKRMKVKHWGDLTPRSFATFEDMLKIGKGKIFFKVCRFRENAKALEKLLDKLDAWESVMIESFDVADDRNVCSAPMWNNIRSGKLQVMPVKAAFSSWVVVAPECTADAFIDDIQERGLAGIANRIFVPFVYGPGNTNRTDDEGGWEKALKEGVTIFRTNRPKELGKFLKRHRRLR